MDGHTEREWAKQWVREMEHQKRDHQIADIRCHAAGAYQRLVREGAVHRANAAEKMGTTGTVGLPYFMKDPSKNRGHWAEQFERPEQPFWLELGCGKGTYAARVAADHPGDQSPCH